MCEEILVRDEAVLQKLMALAETAREKAYCPYSHYAVGAALMDAQGRVWLGANVENGAFSPTCCAERVALFKAIYDGARDFYALAIAGGELGQSPSDCAPCGVCRQVMAEFFSPGTMLFYRRSGEIVSASMAQILPDAFAPL